MATQALTLAKTSASPAHRYVSPFAELQQQIDRVFDDFAEVVSH